MKVQIEEKSLELALVKAGRQLGVTQSELKYKVLKKSEGFLGIFGKKISVEAWVRKNDTFPKRIPMKEVSEQKISLEKDLKNFLAGIYYRMYGKTVKIHVKKDAHERLILDLQCDKIASLLKNNSRISEAFEHLLRKKPRYLKSELPFRIFVDAKSTRLHKEKDLVNMAKDLSNKVYENQKPIVLNYQTPYDRKIIHIALDKDLRVYTKSIGVGQNRKLMILPSKEANG